MRKGWESWICSSWRGEAERQPVLLSTISWSENDRARVFLRAHSDRMGRNGSNLLQDGTFQIDIRGKKIPWGWSDTDTGCPEMLCSLQLWTCTKLTGHGPEQISLDLFWSGHNDNLNSGDPSQPKTWFWNSGSILEILGEKFYLLVYWLPQRYEHFKPEVVFILKSPNSVEVCFLGSQAGSVLWTK